MVPTVVLSAFLNNTAVVLIMIPILVSWSQRLGVHPGKLLMPLSYAAQLGGTCTLLGSSICLVAKGSVPEKVYDMQFFDLAPVGVCLAMATMIYICLLIFMVSSSADKGSTEASAPDDSTLYTVVMLVKKDYQYDGADTA